MNEKDILTVAFEGGSNHWIERVDAFKLKNGTTVYEVWVDMGAGLECHLLSEAGISAALDEIRESGYPNVPKMSEVGMIAKQVMFSEPHMWDFDAGDCDAIVQLAVFGGLVFG